MGETVFSQNIGSEMILMAPTTLKLNLSHLVEKKKDDSRIMGRRISTGQGWNGEKAGKVKSLYEL